MFHRIRMTLPAKALHVSEKKILPFGGMRLMAVQTTHLINDGPVNPVLIEGLVHHLAVAPSQLKIPLLVLMHQEEEASWHCVHVCWQRGEHCRKNPALFDP
jgi:hypothetical protein